MAKSLQNVSTTINLTGYRLLFLLRLLMQGAISKERIIKECENNEYIREISYDTIRLDINTLKNAGFDITNSIIDGEYVYMLKSHPLEIKFTKEDIKVLNRIKKIAIELWKWEDIISLYETLEKILQFTDNEEYKDSVLNFGYFMKIDFQILKELHRHCLQNNEIAVKYNSPKNGNMRIKMRALWIEHDKNTNKMHLFGQFEHYNYISYLRIDKITKIEKIYLKPSIKPLKKEYKTYKVKNTANFTPLFNEEIIEETSDFITVKTTVVNDFSYVQRILSLGKNVVEVDKHTSAQIMENLLKTREVYK